MNRIFIILLLCFIGNNGIAQKVVPGVFGKKNIFTISARVSPTYINYVKKTKEVDVFRFGPRVFDVSLYIAYDRILSRRSVLGISYTYDPILADIHGTTVPGLGIYNNYIIGDQWFYNHQVQLNYKL